MQALSWTFYLLLQHPEVEQKILAEIREVLVTETQPGSDAAAGANNTSSSGSDEVLRPSYAQLRRLKYTRAVFLEVLRLYPSVPEVRSC